MLFDGGARPRSSFFFLSKNLATSTSLDPSFLSLFLKKKKNQQARPTFSSTWPSRPRSTGRTSGWCAR